MINEELEKLLTRAVVGIEAGGAQGSGWVALPNGLIVTNAHVVGYRSEVLVRSFHARARVPATVIAIDIGRDLALLLPQQSLDISPLTWGDSAACKLGAAVWAIGHPFGLALTITRGIVSAPRRKVGDHEYLQADTAINPGNSGGPLIDQNGKVLGVNTWKMRGGANLGFAVPMHQFSDWLQSFSDDRALLSNRRPTYICPECDGPFSPQDDFCGVCGSSLPFLEDDNLLEAKERRRAAYLVAALLKRMGFDPVASRVDPRHWRIRDFRGDIWVTLSGDGEFLGFEAPICKVPSHQQESAYRFLLTYSGANEAHLRPLLRAPRVVALAFQETTSFLAQEEVVKKMGRLRDEVDKLRPILTQHFGAPALSEIDDDIWR